jgi:transposase
MIGRLAAQEQLFYRFRIEDHVPADHPLRRIDRLLDFDGLRPRLAALYSSIGRPSIDLPTRMLLVGYLYGIRSETRLCEEVHLNLAYRWFCKLGLEGRAPGRSSFSKNRHGRFAKGDGLRSVFEMVGAQVRRRRAGRRRHDPGGRPPVPPRRARRDCRSVGQKGHRLEIAALFG